MYNPLTEVVAHEEELKMGEVYFLLAKRLYQTQQ